MRIYLFNFISTETWILVYWQAENSVTVHWNDEAKGWPKDKSEGIGDECQVLFGKKLYSGVVAAVGELDWARPVVLIVYKSI